MTNSERSPTAPNLSKQLRRAVAASPVLGPVARNVAKQFSLGRYARSAMRQCSVAMPGGRVIEIDYPRHLYLPRILSEAGLFGYEPLTLATALALAEQSEHAFFDVGANIGLYSMTIASALRKPVMAFEPFPEAAGVLRATIARHDLPIFLEQKALSDKPGSARFYLSAASDMSNSLNGDFRSHVGELNVEVTTLDAAAARMRPGVIKIDTETTEIDILHGARETLIRDRPAVLLEILDLKDRDVKAEITAFMSEIGYGLTPLDHPAFQNAMAGLPHPDKDGDARNWIATPEPPGGGFFDRVRHWAHELAKLGAPGHV
jgi:FkbM family methyltransferase